MTDGVEAKGIPSNAGVAIGALVTAGVFVVGLLWAKWTPYLAKALRAERTHHWPGSSILTVGGVHSGDGQTWHAATTFSHAYFSAIWPALLVALLISASVQAFLPRSWLVSTIDGPTPSRRAGTIMSQTLATSLRGQVTRPPGQPGAGTRDCRSRPWWSVATRRSW